MNPHNYIYNVTCSINSIYLNTKISGFFFRATNKCLHIPRGSCRAALYLYLGSVRLLNLIPMASFKMGVDSIYPKSVSR